MAGKTYIIIIYIRHVNIYIKPIKMNTVIRIIE